MTPSRAKEVLEGMGLETFTAERLYTGDRGYLDVDIYAGQYAILDGREFSIQRLQAIALWMQDPEGVTNAQTNTVEVVRDE